MRLIGRMVKLRLLNINDAELTLNWRLSERAKYLNKGSKTVQQQENWILNSEKQGDLNFIIEYQDQRVGMISLYEINQYNNSAIMGRLLIGEQEVVSTVPVVFEAEMLLLDYAFDKMSLNKIYGDVRADNTGLIQFRKYLKWHQDGVMREHYMCHGQYQDAIMYSLLNREYHNNCRRKLSGIIEVFLKSKK